jgi:hypothetical protein
VGSSVQCHVGLCCGNYNLKFLSNKDIALKMEVYVPLKLWLSTYQSTRFYTTRKKS